MFYGFLLIFLHCPKTPSKTIRAAVQDESIYFIYLSVEGLNILSGLGTPQGPQEELEREVQLPR